MAVPVMPDVLHKASHPALLVCSPEENPEAGRSETTKKIPGSMVIDPGMPWFIHVSKFSLVQRENSCHLLRQVF